MRKHITKKETKTPKNIKSIPSRVKAKSYFMHMNVKKLTNGGRNKNLYKNVVEWFISSLNF